MLSSGIDKIALKAHLIKQREKTLERLRSDYAAHQSGGDLNLEDVRDADDDSHREQTEEYLQALEIQIHQREDEIRLLRELDFSNKSYVSEGAVALVDEQYFIVGIPACQFELDGKHFVAMSSEAPFYRALMNRKQNDSFVFNNRTFTVESVF